MSKGRESQLEKGNRAEEQRLALTVMLSFHWLRLASLDFWETIICADILPLMKFELVWFSFRKEPV